MSENHSRGQQSRNRLGAWLRLGLGVLAIVVFMFGLAPLLERFTPVGELTAFVQERDLDAGAYWWSDSEEYAPAWLLCRDSHTAATATDHSGRESGTIPDQEPDPDPDPDAAPPAPRPAPESG